MRVAAVDSGVSGYISLYDSETGGAEFLKNPFIKSNVHRYVLETNTLDQFFRDKKVDLVVFEKQQLRGNNSKVSISVSYWCGGMIHQYFVDRGYSIKYVSPVVWQKKIHPGIKTRDELKKASIAFASLHTGLDMKFGKKSADDNAADAFCIAYFVAYNKFSEPVRRMPKPRTKRTPRARRTAPKV